MSAELRVLLVEDDASFAAMVQKILGSAGPSSVQWTHAATLATALEQLQFARFDAILLDLSLPDTEGIETVAAIHGAALATPIVVLTGWDDEELAVRAVREGAQDYLIKGQADRHHLVRALRHAMERARLEERLRESQKMEAIGRLAGGISHDFNNLLTIIAGYTDLLLAVEELDEPTRRYVTEIRKASSRAAGLTRQLLAFSRRQVLQQKVLNLNAIVSDMEVMLRRVIREDIELITHLAPDLGYVFADPSQMEQVLLNLVVNAREAIPRGGAITIETVNTLPAPPEDHSNGFAPARVMLSVHDTGHGMAAETISHIFEPFFSTKPFGKGTGLGLATVYGIVKQSGGDLEVWSEPGQGTTFRLFFPRVEPSSSLAPAVAEAARVERGSESILLAEDEDRVRELLAGVLRENGYQVVEARNGSEALEVLTAGSTAFDLLITDMVMPVMGGEELAERARDLVPALPMLFISGYTEVEISPQARANFLQKPFTPDALLRKVRATFDQR